MSTVHKFTISEEDYKRQALRDAARVMRFKVVDDVLSGIYVDHDFKDGAAVLCDNPVYWNPLGIESQAAYMAEKYKVTVSFRNGTCVAHCGEFSCRRSSLCEAIVYAILTYEKEQK